MGEEPIEKKFLYHVFPGALTWSLGAPGCNLSCRYCINWRVSQTGSTDVQQEVPPEEVVRRALASNARILAFTYTEPTIFIEYATAIAVLARRAGLRVVVKSNGYMTSEVLGEMLDWCDAINIDIKGWDETSHLKLTGAPLQPILDNLLTIRKARVWLEVSTLLVPGFNCDDVSLSGIASFISQRLGRSTPWHLLRFFPNHLMLSQPTTSESELNRAHEVGQNAGLRYIYSKDLARPEMEDTICPGCRRTLIERNRQVLRAASLVHGRCPECRLLVPGIGLSEETRTDFGEANF